MSLFPLYWGQGTGHTDRRTYKHVHSYKLTLSIRHSEPLNIAPTMAKFLANDPPLCLISFIACLAVCLVGSSVIAGSRPAVNNPNAPPSKYPNRKRDHIHDCVYICTTYSCVCVTVFSTWLYVVVTMCDTKDTCSCSLEATAGHCSFHIDLCRCLGSRCVLQPLVGLDCTAQHTPPISNVLNNLWKPNSSWSLSLQLRRKTEKL